MQSLETSEKALELTPCYYCGFATDAKDLQRVECAGRVYCSLGCCNEAVL